MNVLFLKVRAITSPPLIKLGIDGGGSFLKFNLSVISNGGNQNAKRSSASNDKSLLTVEHGQETSTKHQLLVAVAENVSKTYENVKKILSLFGTIDVPFFIACDMKLSISSVAFSLTQANTLAAGVMLNLITSKVRELQGTSDPLGCNTKHSLRKRRGKCAQKNFIMLFKTYCLTKKMSNKFLSLFPQWNFIFSLEL